jgi:WD40 repeat protein
VKTWDAASGERILTLRGHVPDRWINAVLWSPDGTRLASGGWDQTVKVWDTATGQELVSLRGHTGAVWTLAWSSDGKRLASAGFDGDIRVWDPLSGEELLSLRAELPGRSKIESVAWSHDGVRLAAAGGGRIKIWDAHVGYAYARTPVSLRELAQHLAARGEYKEAIAILEKLAADSPEVADYADMLAQTYYAQGSGHEQDGHFDQAIADYTEAIRLKPEVFDCYYSRGEAYAGGGALDEAIADYTEAIRLAPTYAVAYARRGLAYAQKFDATLARHLKLRVEDKPQYGCYPEPFQSFEPTDDLRQAVADYLEFIRLDPTLRDYRRATLGAVYVEGGSLRLEQGNAEAAITDYTEAIRVYGGNARAFCGRGIAHFRLGHVDEALADCLEAIRLEPNNALYDPDCLPNYFSLENLEGEKVKGITFASDIPWVSASSGYKAPLPFRDQDPYGRTVRVAGRPYRKLLFVQPYEDERPADVVFDTSAHNFVQFKADVGPTWSGGLNPQGSIQFQVLVDGNLTAETPLLHPGDLHTFRVDVAEAGEVILRLLNGGDGNSFDEDAWGNARFLEAGADDPLEPSLKLRPDSDPAAWMFAAMLHSKLGNRDEARTWYNKAAGWIAENDPDNEDLCSLQAKAEQVLRTALSDPTEEEKPPESEEDSD